ncbi:MAG: hypothetical protein QM817_15415 [Archangium sp.]
MRPIDPSHETIGSDIQAVIHALRHPEPIIGAEWVARLQKLDPKAWYPINTLLELLDAVVKRGGHASLLQVGRQLFRDSHQARTAPTLKSAHDVVYGIDGWYHHANRGQNIGGWEVLKFGPGMAHLRKTTPHKCALEEGILHEALHIIGADSLIVQPKCVERGDAACEFELRSSVRDQRWGA